MKYYSIGEFAKLIGKTIQTLRNWDNNGKLKAHHISKGGFRYYRQYREDWRTGISWGFDSNCNGV